MASDERLSGPNGPGGAGDVTARPMAEADISSCLDLLRGGLAYPPQLLETLPSFWSRHIAAGDITSTVAEVPDGEGRPRIAAFGASVFVTPEWIAAQWSSDEPYLTARTVLSDEDGATPIVHPADVSLDGEGAHILVLHYGERRDVPPEVQMLLRYRVFEEFVASHRGFRVMSVLQEFWDEIDPAFATSGWGGVINDYSTYFERTGHPRPFGGLPVLVGVTREQVETNPGSLAAPLFLHTPARLGFTNAEKRVLRQALGGSTDEETAAELALSLATVKSHWRSIHHRVARNAPELAGSEPPGLGGSGRGKEKRRRLLDYIRRHPEELRPGPGRR